MDFCGEDDDVDVFLLLDTILLGLSGGTSFGNGCCWEVSTGGVVCGVLEGPGDDGDSNGVGDELTALVSVDVVGGGSDNDVSESKGDFAMVALSLVSLKDGFVSVVALTISSPCGAVVVLVVASGGVDVVALSVSFRKVVSAPCS